MTRTSANGDMKIGQGGSASSSSSAITTTAVDTALWGKLTLLMTGSAGSIVVTCQSSDDGSNYASDTAIVGDTTVDFTSATHGQVAYVGEKRYVKFILTPTSATFSYANVLSEKRMAV